MSCEFPQNLHHDDRFSPPCDGTIPACGGGLAALLLALMAVSSVAVADDQKPQPAAPDAAVQDEAKPADADKHAVGEESGDSNTVAPEYIRIRKNERRLAVALETSIIRFGNSSRYPGATVDLIGAIHLGEPDYYDALNERFKSYDVLLYEAVMPEEAVREGLRPGGGEGSRRPGLSDEEEWTDAKIGFTAISVLQLGMKEALGMEFQLAGVDYTPDNFVHADMTAEEFESSMARRGESFAGMFLTEMGKSLAAQQEQNPLAMNLDMMLSALSKDRFYRARRIFASQLVKAGDGEAFATLDGSSTIITERNKKCLEVMHQQLNAGKVHAGIFYGAGHFKDMEERMVKDYGFQRQSEEWLVAWHLRDPAAKK
jgi:hypothetical protein